MIVDPSFEYRVEEASTVTLDHDRLSSSQAEGSMTQRPTVVAAEHKGFPGRVIGASIDALATLGLSIDELSTPALIVLDARLRDNHAGVRRRERCGDRAARQTTMSPQIVARQLDAGAWGVTVATPAQARVMYGLGARRVLLANELVDPDGIAWLGARLDADSSFVAYCYVDSADGVAILDEALAARGQKRPLPVLVEVGIPGGRGGVRDVETAERVATVVAGARHLSLAGVGGFEGILGDGSDPGEIEIVESYLARVREVADRVWTIRDRNEEMMVTAGGSVYLELVPRAFDRAWRAGRDIRVVLRSGCFVTHDSGVYERYRGIMRDFDPVSLSPALELWTSVLSVPEPGLAILDVGKRDVGVDAGYPTLLHLVRRGTGTRQPPPAGTITALNDQHAYLRLDHGAMVRVGDRLGLGISHPCTTFDKWRLIAVVDGRRVLVGVAETLF